MSRNKVLAWLDSDEAVQRATRELTRKRLNTSLIDDVLQDARLKVWALVDGNAPIDNPAAYGMRTITNVVGDLHRYTRRRAPTIAVDDLDPADHEVELPPGLLEDDLRRVAMQSIARQPWAAAAVMAHITFALHGDVALPLDAPSTDGSAKQIDWAALWLAGEHRCFASASAATRVRRGRALNAVRAHLGEVVAAALGDSEQ